MVNIGRVFGGGLRGIAGDEENTKKAKCGKVGVWGAMAGRAAVRVTGRENSRKTAGPGFFQRSVCSASACEFRGNGDRLLRQDSV
jgi:hypothetical protein